ncbi:MAG: ABC transporter permease [Actinobacteria bacterium]|nr:ABC transporter permease [Actinomycetota bacterium]
MSVTTPRLSGLRSVPARRKAGGGASRHLLAVPALGWWALLFIAPLILLIIYSFGQLDIITFQFKLDWTLENYSRLGNSLYLSTIGRSLLLALSATVGCLVLGFPVAYFMSRQAPGFQRILILSILLPFWASFVIRTYAWIDVLGDHGPIADLLRSAGLIHGNLGLDYTPAAIAIGMTATYMPLMILPLFVALERVPDSLLQAASDLGASNARTMRRVVLPLAKPGIYAGCLLVGIPATGEYVIPAILGGGKTLMFGNVIGEQFQNTGDYPFGAALATSFMAALTVFLVFVRRRQVASEVQI